MYRNNHTTMVVLLRVYLIKWKTFENFWNLKKGSKIGSSQRELPFLGAGREQEHRFFTRELPFFRVREQGGSGSTDFLPDFELCYILFYRSTFHFLKLLFEFSRMDSGSSLESPVCSVRASVMMYNQTEKRWYPCSGNGISRVCIYQHPQNRSFRVVGRKNDTQELSVHCSIVRGLIYNEATATFHQWRHSGSVYGWVVKSFTLK